MASNDPSKALHIWYTLFNKVLDNHEKLKKKRVKSRFKPKWLTAQINDYRKNGTCATNEKILPITKYGEIKLLH